MQTGTVSRLTLREILKTRKRLRVEHFCIFGSATFVSISWMCKKQTCVSHSSTESENISLDVGLRMDGIPALDLWDLFVDVIYSKSEQTQKDKHAQGDPLHGKGIEFSG